jgi:hypothetical protein
MGKRQEQRSSERSAGTARWSGAITAVALVALCVTALLLAACGGGTESTATTGSVDGTGTTGVQPQGEAIVVGAIVSATGNNSPLGEPERKVLEMMESTINESGGVLGRPLDIVIEDDKSDAKAAATAATRLIDQEKVVAIIAATGSPSTLAVKEITARMDLEDAAQGRHGGRPGADVRVRDSGREEDRSPSRRERIRFVWCHRDCEESGRARSGDSGHRVV